MIEKSDLSNNGKNGAEPEIKSKILTIMQSFVSTEYLTYKKEENKIGEEKILQEKGIDDTS
jgi:hypothetical protein